MILWVVVWISDSGTEKMHIPLANRTADERVEKIAHFGLFENLIAFAAEMALLVVQSARIAEHGNSAVLVCPAFSPKWRRCCGATRVAANISTSSTGRVCDRGSPMDGPLLGRSTTPADRLFPRDFGGPRRARALSKRVW